MTILHMLNQAPSSDTLVSCLRCLAPGDKLLLLEDAVYAACEPTAESLRQTGCDCYVLAADAAARGIANRLDTAVKTIDHRAFVELAVTCDAVQSWY